MAEGSEYPIPIFISSPEYNLVDLRAELQKYLRDLGYKPILSSSEGFQDGSPHLAPWEACLSVLETCFIVILIIDGRYGQALDWNNFEDSVKKRKVSPTHGEYLHANFLRKRILVFVRREVESQHQSYKAAMKSAGGDRATAMEYLSKTLPKHIEFEALEFFAEVKTSQPIPWVKSFDNVTDIKSEVQKKLLNELAEIFLFKSKHLEAVVREFSKAVADLPEEKRKEFLQKVGVTKDLLDEIDKRSNSIEELRKEKSELMGTLDQAKKDLEATGQQKKEKAALEAKVKEMTSKMEELQKKISQKESGRADYIFGSTGSVGLSSALTSGPSLAAGGTVTLNPLGFQSTCESCGNAVTGQFSTVYPYNGLRFCPGCSKYKCDDCFGLGLGSILIGTAHCKECRSKRLGGTGAWVVKS
jgi:hypothetical protein